MRQILSFFAIVVASSFTPNTFGASPSPLAAPLPSFDAFRRMDHERRTSGQLQTAESLDLMHVDAALIAQTADQHRTDSQIQWGAAELFTDWTRKQAQFETALAVSGTNAAIALRFACDAAKSGKLDTAKTWLQHCQKADLSNAVPWLVMFWISSKQGSPLDAIQPPACATQFRDALTQAALARIRLLEAAGYSPYAARRVGVLGANMTLPSMLRELSKQKLPDPAARLLLTTAQAMQHETLFITELVGQTVEKSLLQARPDAQTSTEIAARLERMAARRESIKRVTTDMERIVDAATESEMVQYFDDILTLGEEEAMNRLAKTVQKKPATK
jgi:hypothetical protein